MSFSGAQSHMRRSKKLGHGGRGVEQKRGHPLSAIAASRPSSGVHVREPYRADRDHERGLAGVCVYGTQAPTFFVAITGSFDDSGFDCGGRPAVGPAHTRTPRG